MARQKSTKKPDQPKPGYFSVKEHGMKVFVFDGDPESGTRRYLDGVVHVPRTKGYGSRKTN